MSEQAKKPSFEEQLRLFAADGNEVVGAPAVAAAQSSLTWTGKGHSLYFGADVHMKATHFTFSGRPGRIEIGARVQTFGRIAVAHGSSVSIGADSFFNKTCLVQAWEGRTIAIGSGCLFGHVNFRTSDTHSIIDRGTGERINLARDIVLGDRVWLADNVDVFKGVHIGQGSIVGAHSLVVKDIPEFSLAVGIPARVVKTNVTWDRRIMAAGETFPAIED